MYRIIAAFALSLILAGCDSIHSEQLLLRPVTTAPAVGDERATAIKEAIASVAASNGLEDRTSTSAVARTIAYYVEQVRHFPVAVGARVVQEGYVVDIQLFHPGWHEPAKYKRVRAELIDEIRNKAREDAIVLPAKNHIAIEYVTDSENVRSEPK